MRADAVPDVETAVLDRARRGDHEAFAIVVRHYDPQLRALAYRLLGSRDRMDDALQEAYVKAFRALPRFRGQSQLGTWLHRIVFNACLDELGRLRRAEAVPLEDAPEPSRRARTTGTSSQGGSSSRTRWRRWRRTTGRLSSSSTARGSTTRRPPKCSVSRLAPSPRA